VCAVGENPCTCSQDCGAQQTLETSCEDSIDNDCDGQTDATDPDCAATGCGNQICDEGETCQTCLGDCPGKQTGPITKQYCCGNGVLEGPEAADLTICDGNY
jgi:hypothetical protein